LTGGPGAGKTAVLEVIKQHFCEHVVVLPEAATIVFQGGFPRGPTEPARRAAQLAIFHVQRELEQWALEEKHGAVVLCDRGTIDGLAYWPGSWETFWHSVGTSPEKEIARYAAVVHMRTPAADTGYNHVNPMRIESPAEAARIDKRIALAWADHPRRFFVESQRDFMVKTAIALQLVNAELPECCRLEDFARAGAALSIH
jgi:predicted ATPase